MTLLETIEAWYADNDYPPEFEGYDTDTGFTLVDTTHLDSLRWGNRVCKVYGRQNNVDSEFVAVESVEPATEMQDWGDYGKPEIYVVEPVVEIIEKVTYKKV